MVINPTQQILENLAGMLNKLDKYNPLVGDALDLIALDSWTVNQYHAAADLVDRIHAIVQKIAH